MPGKYRHELKFICPDSELKLAEHSIRSVMSPDSHADKNGEYLIRSVYFDDIYRSCFYDNENGVSPRTKYRIRTYNRLADRILLERKIKDSGLTAKTACNLDIDKCNMLLSRENVYDCRDGSDGLYDRFIADYRSRLLKPVILIEYVRKPYVFAPGNVRVTFDMNISASRDVMKLFDEHISRIGILPASFGILEVKYDDFLPDAVLRLVNRPHMQQSTFSKFYLGSLAAEGRLYNVF